MGSSRRILLIFLFHFFLAGSAENAFSQEGILKEYKYLSPLPYSSSHNPGTVILIRFGEKIDFFSLKDEFIEVTGDSSGRHHGRFNLSLDQFTLIFTPDQMFSFNEKVTLHLKEGIKTISNILLPPFCFWFTIRQKTISDLYSDSPEVIEAKYKLPFRTGKIVSPKGTLLSFLDFKFPEIVLSDQPTQGNMLTTLEKNGSNYLYVFDNKAIPVYAKLMPHSVSNLKTQPSGKVTFYDSFLKGFIVLDSCLNHRDTLFMKNGYRPDAHEVLMLKNGNVFLFSYDPRIVDMSKVVTGGNPAATVTGLVIQELDANSNLVFQWRSWDYFSIKDSYSDLFSSVIDYVHGNSLDADTDTSLIISSRNLNEITKINRLTGKIIWRLGGKNNEFVFENDPRGFGGQHTALKQKNGTLTLFDNGVGLTPVYSRGIEYEIDEINKKVKLLHEYRYDPDLYANISGNLQRLDNGNTFIFWGPSLDHSEQIISELDKTGKAIFKASFGISSYPTYRVYKSMWHPELFTFTDTLQIESVLQNSTLYRTFNIKNNSKKEIIITSAHHKNLGFYVKDLPKAINAGGEAIFTVAFPSYIPGKISDNIIFCQETDSTLVTRSLFVSVDNAPDTGIEDNFQAGYKVGPNPGSGEFFVELSSPGSFNVKVIDLTGKTIWRAIAAGPGVCKIDLRSKPDGFYLLWLYEESSGIFHTLKLVKRK